MLKLVKNTSDENYPITPQTSAVRKLKVRGSVNTGADLYDSYIVVKNGCQTTLNGGPVVRNVGWGQVFSQKEIWEYSATCQVKYATLKIDGQVVEYNEDLNVRAVNMDVYEANHERRKKYSNVGSYGFQRLEAGPKTMEPDAAASVRSQGLYLSPFLDETVEYDDTGIAPLYKKTGCAYKEVATVLYLADLFKFCDSLDAKSVYMGGKEITVELQFENYNQILAEVVNYPTDLTSVPNQPRPYLNQTFATDPASIQPQAAGADLTAVFTINTVSTFQHVNQVPLYVGQPICLWALAGLPAAGAAGSNIAVITQLSVPAAGGVCTISFKAYTSANGNIRLAAGVVTAAQFFANVFAAGNGICVAISGVNDPVRTAGNVTTTYTNIDAGLSSQYTVNGIELVLVEKPMMTAQKNTINFIKFMRDTDVIPQGQLSYNKSFQLDPNCVSVHCMFPPKYSAASGQTNLLSLSRHNEALPTGPNNVSDGLSYRCLINGQELYSRDIAFGATDSVEPLYYHRLTLSAMNMGMVINNLSLNAPFVAMNGNTVHAMISEPVPQSEQQQQLNVKLVFTTNATDRTIYVYKAVRSQLTF